MNVGFDKPLYVLPFDHRGSFQTKMFGWKGTLTSGANGGNRDGQASDLRCVQGCRRGRCRQGQGGHPRRRAVRRRHSCATLPRMAITRLARRKRAARMNSISSTARTSAKHIEAFQPTFCKVLVRFNPEGR